MTKNFDVAVKPMPILQTINVVIGLIMLAWEWPLGFLAGSAIHRSISARLVFLPLAVMSSALLYQNTNPAIYYTIAMVVYFWAYSEGEVCPATCQWRVGAHANDDVERGRRTLVAPRAPAN